MLVALAEPPGGTSMIMRLVSMPGQIKTFGEMTVLVDTVVGFMVNGELR